MSEISESAKAVQEIAKTANTGIAISRDFGKFVARLIGEPLEIASNMLSDKLRFVRAERLIRLDSCFEEMIRKARHYRRPPTCITEVCIAHTGVCVS
jgi:hypothetical protein